MRSLSVVLLLLATTSSTTASAVSTGNLSSPAGPNVNADRPVSPAMIRRQQGDSSESKSVDTPLYWKPFLFVDSSACTTGQTEAISEAIRDVHRLAQAALNALNDPSVQLRAGNPALYFFGDSPHRCVAEVFQAAYDYTRSSSPLPPPSPRRRDTSDQCFGHSSRQPKPSIRIACDDVKGNICNDFGYGVPAYVRWSNPSTIVICDDFYASSRLGPPCARPVSADGVTGLGALNRASTLVHEFAHAYSKNRIDDLVYGSRGSIALVDQDRRGRRAWLNADSYGWMASWAFDLGLETLAEGPLCLDRFVDAVYVAGAGEGPQVPG